MDSLTPQRALVVLLVCGGIYGAVMGSFGGARTLQMLFSAVKVPLLISATFALSLPAYFVVATLLGLRDDLAASIRALLATQAVLTVLLASFATFTLLWYASSSDYSSALLFNGIMFGAASVFAQRVLARLFRPLIARDPKHRNMMLVWLLTYAFVGIQMAWMLRPFVGNLDDPTTFFREEGWGNAYEVMFSHLRQALGL